MTTPPDLAEAIADIDDVYLHVQLLLAQHRAGSENPSRSGLWHALALMFTEEQVRRGGPPPTSDNRAAVKEARESLIRDAAVLEAEYADAVGEPADAHD